EADAAQARRARVFHHEKIAGAATPVAGPRVVQGLDHDQVRSAARFIRETLPLAFGKLARNPMGPVQLLDLGAPAPAEAQRLSLRRPRDVVRLAREQALRACPGPERFHALRDARQICLNGTLEAI